MDVGEVLVDIVGPQPFWMPLTPIGWMIDLEGEIIVSLGVRPNDFVLEAWISWLCVFVVRTFQGRSPGHERE